ncbi:metal-binding protein [Arthrobacter sp. MYb229]|uniref:heavy-metal-associated domain-containing protein n=1 Tax=unclassified Arthrobacter TaxID=235627 RepID=UPI000CFD08F5|nr:MULTISPECIES: heavy-metal-associated domain-containing protein [unclassified Arthrobacter]PRA04482.1 metal-binding protein [Arthrobacter sp. MYb229]PRB51605.1 metal-binding protein [Arthrobacter sp. MYb216]
MSHACNCGCSDNSKSTSQGLQIIPRPEATPIISQTELKISGMTCGHCVSSVTEELNEIPEVQNVEIILDAKGISTAILSTSGAVEQEIIRNAIEEAGYTLESVGN